ncbi:MAG: M23 family metallopeptidase [Spirochaetales bacterium]|nr:M23 family metallopeptidase [Spirochaetales bacterium]
MTTLIEKQKIGKRQKTGSLLKAASLKVENIIPEKQKPAKRKKSLPSFTTEGFMDTILHIRIKTRWFLKKLFRGKVFSKNMIISAASVFVLTAALGAVFILNNQGESLEIPLPDDTILQTHLMDYASVEFSGQGSGEILPAASVLIPSVNPVNYTVQPGDTISEIAKKHGLSEGTLIGYNSVTDVYRLIPGTELNIPDIDGMPYQVKNGDSLNTIATHFNVSLNSILDANDLDDDILQPGQNLFIPGANISDYEYKKATKTLFIYPARGRLSSGYGYRSDPFTGVRRFHYGIDLANSTGTAIKASMEGTVIDVQDKSTGYGKCVIIRHANGFQTLYGHLDSISVRKNQWVSQGQTIGRMGTTGRSTGPHLHFSIYKNNNTMNPLTYLFN